VVASHDHGEAAMSARLSRRTLLAGLAAMPALALVGCDDDRTSAAPIRTAGTLDFANRLRIPALAESTMDHDGVRIFRLSASTGSAEFFAGVSSERPVLSSLPWDLNMITPLTNGAGGNDHLDLLQLWAATSLSEGVSLPDLLSHRPAVAVDDVEGQGMMAQFTVVDANQVGSGPRTLHADHQHPG
jgi:hypothetical protein